MKPIVRALLAATFLGSAVAALAPLPALAADTPKVSNEVAKYLGPAQKALATKDLDGALADVKQAQAVSDRTPYDDYLINAFLAQIYIQKNDYASADAPMEAAADSPAMPEDQKKNTLFNAFQLALSAGHYQKAIGYAQQLEAMNALDPKYLPQIAVAYYKLNDMPHAQQYAQKAIDAAKAAGQTPDENMMIIVMNGQAKQNDTAGLQGSLENLALQYNRPENWQKLVDLAIGAKGLRDIDELNLFRLEFFIPGAMRGEDYAPLASAASAQGYATEAYNVLQRGIREGKVSAGQFGPLYTQARSGASIDEKSLKSIAAEAARAKSGEADIKLAEDYWGYGRYADGEVAARRALSKGGIKDPNEGPMLLGMLLIAQGKYDEGQRVLSQVDGIEARKTTAHLWSLYAQAQMKGATVTQTPAPPH